MNIDCDVVVVGAGLAGLSTARRLQQAGAQVRVVEARDRVGGRTLSTSFEGATFELGAQWVGPAQQRLRSLVHELGLELFPQHHQGLKVVEVAGRRSTYRGKLPSLSLVSLLQIELMLRRVDRMAERIPLDAPYRAHKALEWDASSVEMFKRAQPAGQTAKLLFDVGIRTVFGAEPSELSLLHFLFYLNSSGGFRRLVEIEGGAQQDRFVGGTQLLSQRLAEALGRDNVILSAPVRSIDQRGECVLVEADGARLSARVVVVAIPPHLCARIHYEPPLPASREQLVQRWGMGATVKLLAFYDRAHWRDRGLSGEAVSTDSPISVVFDNSSPDGKVACLLGFVVGKHARRWAGLGADERRRTALAELERLLDAPARSAVHFLEHDWAAEPWTGGCPVATTGPGILGTLGPSWRAACGRILWGGTETARHWNGYLEGALESAERVASEALGYL
ncbi:MAG TPA: FAD-dependent oxidoreductase [Polyangiaceae bacterium]|nr:FAD-dependent oxidoreductase [Polyangiaceae bacterium]